MSVQMQNREVPRTGGGPVPGKPEELAELARRTTNYTGPYHLEETGVDRANVHHETVIAIPSIYNGITQTRLAHITAETGVEKLTLTTGEPAAIEGIKRDIVVTWQRAKDNSTSSKPRQEVSAPFSR
jgi:Lipocalin-like domain